MKTRALLVEDQEIVRRGLIALLGKVKGLEIVGEAGDGLEAIEKTSQLRPDLVFMDVGLPKLSGIEATRRIKQSSAATRVIALTCHTGAKTVDSLVQAGADGVVSKSSSPDELLQAIRAVLGGETFFCAEVKEHCQNAPSGTCSKNLLTPREVEVLQLVAAGRTSKQIGEQLGTSTKTVEVHRYRLAKKLGANTPAALLQRAVDCGYLDLHSIGTGGT